MSDVIQTPLPTSSTGLGDARSVRAQPVAAVAMDSSRSWVDWGAILAGTAVASGFSFVMAFFGSGIGLSLSSPYGGASPLTHYIALALWLLWITLSSFALGGYICGRLRARAADVKPDEAELRDGVHGLTVWATAIIAFAFAASASLYQIGKIGAALVAGEESGAGMKADPVDYQVDTLLRGDGDLTARKGAPAPTAGLPEYPRQVVKRILTQTLATGELSQPDRNYIVNVMASQAGVNPQDAERRVDAVNTNLKNDRDQAKELADKARKIGVLLSFISATAMLLGAAAAWGAATAGGRHRDQNVHVRHLMAWRL